MSNPQPWKGFEYDMEFTLNNCPSCGRETIIGNFKTRDSETGVITDNWLCNKCGNNLEQHIKKAWENIKK